MSSAELRLKSGVYKISKPVQIGSMRVMGARNFVVFSALTASYRKVQNLLVRNFFKKNLRTPTADVIEFSATFDGRPHV
jgi:hypothetical protein